MRFFSERLYFFSPATSFNNYTIDLDIKKGLKGHPIHPTPLPSSLSSLLPEPTELHLIFRTGNPLKNYGKRLADELTV